MCFSLLLAVAAALTTSMSVSRIDEIGIYESFVLHLDFNSRTHLSDELARLSMRRLGESYVMQFVAELMDGPYLSTNSSAASSRLLNTITAELANCVLPTTKRLYIYVLDDRSKGSKGYFGGHSFCQALLLRVLERAIYFVASTRIEINNSITQDYDEATL
ncbi:hypothetical protein EDD22DRAFT_1048226 [Suillus occidentalis]|nr:hypothetical protein EDD22DRAFT_1048226 [Suillus occidentalis]